MRDIPDAGSMTGWYKIHGFMCCLCLWAHQEAAFYSMLLTRVPEAERRAAEFYATRMTPNQALHAAQGLLTDEQLGPDRHKRFVPKTGAKA